MLKKRQSGFTIIEMLVVLVIVGLLAALILTDYRGGQRRYALSQGAQQLVSNIRRAQNMAISGVEIPGVCDVITPCYGYGVHAEEDDDYYIIYGDRIGSRGYQGGDRIIETIYLPDKINIRRVSPLPGGKLSVCFEPPDPTTYIIFPPANPNAVITLEVEDTSITKRVEVTDAGLIQID